MLPGQHTTERRQAVAASASDTPKLLLIHQRRDCRCLRARHRHGTRAAYNRDCCRCPACSAANAMAARQHRLRSAQNRWHGTSPWVDATGTRRRLQALAAGGWSTRALAGELAVTKSAVAQLRSTNQDRVLAATAASVTDLYQRMWWRTPPPRSATRSELYAQRTGWAPPWAWDGGDIDDPAASPAALVEDVLDHVAVQEAVAGRRVRLSRYERRVVVDELTRRRRSAAEIAAQLGITERTVVRDRADVTTRPGQVA